MSFRDQRTRFKEKVEAAVLAGIPDNVPAPADLSILPWESCFTDPVEMRIVCAEVGM